MMGLQKFLPYDNLVIRTELPAAELLLRLNNITEPGSPFRAFTGKPNKKYYGIITDNTFVLTPIIRYRNSFLPLIKGEIIGNGSVTEVRIRMRPQPVVRIFMLIWLGIIGSICLLMFINILAQLNRVFNEGVSPVALIPFGMLAFGYGLMTMGYKAESGPSITFLKQLLQHREADANFEKAG
jgi:hypothetical protein